MKPMPVSLYRPALVNSAMDNGSYASVLDARWTLKSFLKIYEFQDWKHPRQKLYPPGIFFWLHSKILCHGKHFFSSIRSNVFLPNIFCPSTPAHSMMPKELHELPTMLLISWLDGKNKQSFKSFDLSSTLFLNGMDAVVLLKEFLSRPVLLRETERERHITANLFPAIQAFSNSLAVSNVITEWLKWKRNKKMFWHSMLIKNVSGIDIISFCVYYCNILFFFTFCQLNCRKQMWYFQKSLFEKLSIWK